MHPLFVLVPILLPILGGVLILQFPAMDRRKLYLYAEGIVVLTSLCVWAVILFMSRDPVTIYSFTSGFAIDFRADGPAMLFAGMVSLLWPLVMLYAFSYMSHDGHPVSFFGFYVMTYGITLGVAFAADILTMYVFYEMLTLVTIPLVAHYGNRESSFAARRYVYYTIGGASLAFISVVFVTIYGGGGDFALGGCLPDSVSRLYMRVFFILGFFGFGAKAAIFPLHDWLPLASAAPTPVTALLHAVAVVNSGVFAVMRMIYYSYGTGMLEGTGVQTFCILLTSFSLVFAAVMALRERHFKRRLAWSTVSNLSYMLFGLSLMTPAGQAAGLAHMVFHSIIKMTLFLCAGAFMHRSGNAYIYELDGVGKRMPVTFVCYTLGALSLTGIPGFCGFISKWKLLTAGAKAGTLPALTGCICLIVSAFFCAMYTMNVSVRAFFPVRGNDRYEETSVREADPFMLVPILLFSLVNIAFGLAASPLLDLLDQIAGGLL